VTLSQETASLLPATYSMLLTAHRWKNVICATLHDTYPKNISAVKKGVAKKAQVTE